jgi:hypothetical protein
MQRVFMFDDVGNPPNIAYGTYRISEKGKLEQQKKK